jgi:hypothetical protein
MNLYRITVRGRDGKIFDYQIEAASLYLAEHGQDEHFEVLKAERIDPVSGEVLYEFYNEKDLGSI